MTVLSGRGNGLLIGLTGLAGFIVLGLANSIVFIGPRRMTAEGDTPSQ